MLLRSAALRSLVAGASDAIYVIDSDGALLMANAATGALLGAPCEQLVGRTALVYVDTPDQARVEHEMRRVLAGEPRRLECAVLRTDGTRRLISVAATPAYDTGASTSRRACPTLSSGMDAISPVLEMQLCPSIALNPHFAEGAPCLLMSNPSSLARLRHGARARYHRLKAITTERSNVVPVASVDSALSPSGADTNRP